MQRRVCFAVNHPTERNTRRYGVYMTRSTEVVQQQMKLTATAQVPAHLQSCEAVSLSRGVTTINSPQLGCVVSNGGQAAAVWAELQGCDLAGMRRNELLGVSQQIPHTGAVVCRCCGCKPATQAPDRLQTMQSQDSMFPLHDGEE